MTFGFPFMSHRMTKLFGPWVASFEIKYSHGGQVSVFFVLNKVDFL